MAWAGWPGAGEQQRAPCPPGKVERSECAAKRGCVTVTSPVFFQGLRLDLVRSCPGEAALRMPIPKPSPAGRGAIAAAVFYDLTWLALLVFVLAGREGDAWSPPWRDFLGN